MVTAIRSCPSHPESGATRPEEPQKEESGRETEHQSVHPEPRVKERREAFRVSALDQHQVQHQEDLEMFRVKLSMVLSLNVWSLRSSARQQEQTEIIWITQTSTNRETDDFSRRSQSKRPFLVRGVDPGPG